MTKKQYWKDLGFADSYAEHTAKGIRLFMRHIGMQEEDLPGLIKLIEFRNKIKPNMPLEQFVLFLNYLSELSFLTSEAEQGFKKFYKNDETIKEKINEIGKMLANIDNHHITKDPIALIFHSLLNNKFTSDNAITTDINLLQLLDFLHTATEEEKKELEHKITTSLNQALTEWQEKKKHLNSIAQTNYSVA